MTGVLTHEPNWWMRDVVIATIVGTLVSIGGIWGQKMVDDRRGERDAGIAVEAARAAEQLQNLEFVRDKASPDPDLTRPFSYLDLAGTSLVGLELVGADFAYTDLTDANLADSDLADADFSRTVLVGADLNHASLVGAWFSFDRVLMGVATQPGADLTSANLAGANLTDAVLDGATLTDIYYDDYTQWPDGFTPPPSRAAP